MCSTCGCNQVEELKIIKIGDQEISVDDKINTSSKVIDYHHHHHHNHPHSHDHSHMHHSHSHDHLELLLEQDILNKNNLLAERNRGYFDAKSILAINLVSSPGSGKTSILERTLHDLKTEIPFYIIEGDQQTTRDADRIYRTGSPVVQINTGKGCHLDSSMVLEATKKLNPEPNSCVMIENVGNLVCPSLFDLGETARVVIISVTEGDDKPIKYPDMFLSSQLCIINKIDLSPYVDFDVEKAKEYALRVNHHLEFIELSATQGEGMDIWYQWLKNKMAAVCV